MKKMMLVAGMMSGMAIAYIMFDKSARKMVMKKMECILNSADKMMKNSIDNMM